MNALHDQPWWVYLLRGIASLSLGVLVLAVPPSALLLLTALYAGYAFVCGFAALSGGLPHSAGHPRTWRLVVLGVISIGIGVIAVAVPAMTASLLLVLIGANALAMGVVDLSMGLSTGLHGLRSARSGLAVAGAVALLFAAYVIVVPTAGAAALAWLISLYALVTGALFVGLAFVARSLPIQRFIQP